MGSLVNRIDELYESAICEDALDDDGYVLTYTGRSTEGNCIKHTTGVRPCGIGLTSTKDPVTAVATANKPVTIVKHGLAYVKLKATNAAIAVGDPIVADDAGLADKMAAQTIDDATHASLQTDIIAMFTKLAMQIGLAAESKAVNAGGKCLVSLNIRGTSIPTAI